MAKWDADDVVRLLTGILLGGRGQHNPENPILGVPSFSEALGQDREAAVARMEAEVAELRRRFPGSPQGSGIPLGLPRSPAKKKRRVSAYQKEFGRQLKRLKREHPRTPVTRLMKRAHAATRRARKGK